MRRLRLLALLVLGSLVAAAVAPPGTAAGQATPVASPGAAGGTTCDALTTAVDLHATLLDLFAADAEHRTHGRSLLPLLDGTASSIREHVLCGIWGREVQLIDRTHKYVRAPVAGNAPLSMWSNRWSTMPVPWRRDERLPRPDERAFLDRMPGSSVPVIRQPFRLGHLRAYWAGTQSAGNHLYDLREDRGEERNLAGSPCEADAAERLCDVLLELEAPDEQLVRLGLA